MTNHRFAALAAMVFILSGCLGNQVPYSLNSKTVTNPKPSSSPRPSPTPTPSLSPLPAPGGGSLPYGAVSVSLSAPTISGWAQDADNLSAAVTTELYVNGPMGQGGVLVGAVLANMPRTLFPIGNYGISVSVPAGYQDGKVRRLFAYGVDDRAPFSRILLSGSPYTFVAGTNQVGLDYFNNTVRSSVQNSCGGCHNGVSLPQLGTYAEQKSLLMEPSPFVGGSPTNNSIYNKARGINHNGGVICAANAAPCSLFNTWWTNEFGAGHLDGF